MSELTFETQDEFNRAPIADNIIKLLQSDVSISPLLIEGGWGTGKTHFCKKLVQRFQSLDSHSVIYIDAYKADHANEPLLTLLAEILKLVPESERDSKINSILPALRFGAQTILKAGVSHILRQDAEELSKEVQGIISESANYAIDESVSALLKDHIKAESSLKELQNVLSGIAEEKPIVIFIDELDRCKPNFAINMLEVIKHTFNIKNVQFALVTNLMQLEASIKHSYGNGIESAKYLDKFISFRVKLPEKCNSNNHEIVWASCSHFKNQLNNSAVLADTFLRDPKSMNSTNSLFDRFIVQHKISLREVETLIRHIEALATITPTVLSKDLIFGYKMTRTISILISVFMPDVANKIVNGNSDAKDIAKIFGVNSVTSFDPNIMNYPKHYEAFTYFLGQGCFYNSDLYVPVDDASKAIFNKYASELYEYCEPSLDRRLKDVEDILSNMSLFS
ncbi:AAA family ATPase [Vibrio harveyi]